jgi:hypothetical protein
MKKVIALLSILFIAPSLYAQSAADKVEQRLAELLAPGNGGGSALISGQPLPSQIEKAVKTFEAPLKPYAGVPVRLPLPARRDVKPGAIPPGIPLASYRDATPAPQQVELPTKPLIRLPSLDLHTPLALPILAQAAKDRASLADPAFKASLDAAMKRFTPVRDKPLPFAPLNLPDPFEHQRYGEMRNPPSESATPPVVPLTKPK